MHYRITLAADDVTSSRWSVLFEYMNKQTFTKTMYSI